MGEKYYVIDRFEGEYAVCETPEGKLKDYAKVELPRGAREGDVMLRAEDGSFTIDTAETFRRKEKARKLFESLLSDE